MTIASKNFSHLANFIKVKTGILLTEDKSNIIETRLLPIALKNGLATVDALIEDIEKKPEAIVKLVIDALTTNESLFFRDTKPFAQLKDIVMPRLLQHYPNRKTFRIWSAACSTGQEPYSTAISLKENPALKNYNFEIVATDLASHVIERAQSGIYTQFEVQRGLPVTLLVKYFTQEGEKWKVNDSVKSMITFKQLNLQESYASLGNFDIIFCRNVMIYFDASTKNAILAKMEKILDKHGVLFLGASENLIGLQCNFHPLKDTTSIYHLD